MIAITGVYRIPALRHVFLIVPSLAAISDSLELSQASKRRREYIGHILRSKDRTCPIKTPQWKVKVVSENDILWALEQQKPKSLESSSQSSDSPQSMELLAMNLVKTPENSLDWTSNTPKALSVVPDEDIIEVFI